MGVEFFWGFLYNVVMNIIKGVFLFFFVIYALASFSFLRALDPHRRVSQYALHLWTTENGLPQNTIISILQTSDGYMWFGTLEGLARFDGVTFTAFKRDTHPGIKNEYIYTLCEDNDKNLWIGTREGLTVYKNGAFKTFTTVDGLWGNIVRTVYFDTNEVLWIGTSKGLNRKAGIDGEFEKIPRFSSIQVKYIYQDSSKNMWFCTDKGLAQLKHEEFKFFTTRDGLSSNLVQQVLEDDKGNLWITTYGGGLNRLSNGIFTSISKADGLSDDNLVGLCIDRDNNLWIGTEGSGLNRLPLPDGPITILDSKNGLSNNYIGDFICEDKEGSLWIGTEKGLDQLHNGKLITWTTAEGLSDDYISCVYEDSQKRLWVGTYTGGLNILESEPGTGTYRVSTLAGMIGAGNLPGQISSLWEDRLHNIWIGSRGNGLVRLTFTGPRVTGTTFTAKDGLSHNTVWAIYEDHDGIIWVGTRKGLNKFEKGTFRVFGVNEGLNNENIYTVTSDSRGNLWIGTSGGGLNLFKDEKFTAYTSNDGLSDNIILCIYEDQDHKGMLWIGTSYGLNLFQKGKFTCYTTKNGLFDNVVFQILEDSEGFLWMSSNKGISKVKKEELLEFAEGKINRVHPFVYGLNEGMRDVECNGGFQPAGWKSSSDKLFFPTVEGLVMIEPGNEEINRVIPPVYVEKLAVNGKHVIPPGRMIVIGPGVDKLEFHYTALSFLSPKKVKFKLRLSGYDGDWELVGKPRDRVAYYGHLGPGHYTFQVKACNNDGIWNETGTAITVKVLPFFRETWWFRIAALIAFAAISYFVINFIKKYINIFQFWKQKNYIGNYKIIDKIGSGGMGTVYLATHTADPSKKVALKVLKEEYTADSVQTRRFKQEAIIVDQIEHPNIVKIIERGEYRQSIYIAMELLCGETLASKLGREKQLSIPDCLHIMKQVCGAFALIHRKNIIHRDLKPENIMLIEVGADPLFVKLLDFGLARAQTFSRLTESGMVLGTVSYISPEQITGNVYSTASDIYSLGVTFYEMVTGIRPFSGENTIEIMMQILNKNPVEPIRLRKEIPGELNRLIVQMMAKDRKDRPDIKEVQLVLERIPEGK
jgi:ligand-binding sensor domain-containing protein/tRNA A-37 threonylcarbamoyl transferase component Bud32